MKGAVVLVAVYFSVFCFAGQTKWFQLSNQYTFDNYVAEFGKQYSSAEEVSFRKSIFEANLALILKHNADPTQTWKMGVNQFADRTPEEFRRRLGYKNDPSTKRVSKVDPNLPSIAGLPSHVDWRDHDVVTAVKDQGDCGSCWTFGTAETIESHFAIKYGQLTDLSEQQILDCTPNPNQCGGTGGCGGGTARLAFDRIMKMGGLASEWTYSYTSYSGSNFQCQFNGSTVMPVAKLSGYVALPSNVYAPILSAVATHGPLAISVDASSWSFYESGVYNGCNTTVIDLDHEVQLVGYGTDPSGLGDYWLVRNSWSPMWGEKGYIRIARSGKAECGIDPTPSDGDGCKNGPPSIVVCGTCGILYDAAYPLIE